VNELQLTAVYIASGNALSATNMYMNTGSHECGLCMHIANYRELRVDSPAQSFSKVGNLSHVTMHAHHKLFVIKVSFPTRSAGQKPYIMPIGDSNLTGMWGYIEAFRELLDQVNVMCVSCISMQNIA